MSQPYSYRPNMNRNVTRKWAEARQVDYAGDDWGDEDNDDGYGEPAHPPLSQERRSFTNPAPVNTSHRLSFDHGQEQRVFSASAAQPQQNFPPPQPAPLSQPRSYSQQPAYGQPNAAAEQAPRQSSDTFRRDAARPDSRGSNTSARQYPPRKASLGQSDFPDYTRSQPPPPVPAPAPANGPETAPGATPRIITPSEIYRRHAEEERKRSQDSSRPSMDSISRDASDGTPKQSIDIESSRKRQPALDTVAERRSEYLESPTRTPIAPIGAEAQTHAAPKPIHPIDTGMLDRFPSASSRYTDRADPVSASTIDSRFPSRNVSQTDPHSYGQAQPSGLPQIPRVPTFGSDLFSNDNTADNRDATRLSDHAPPVPPKDNGESSLQHQPSHGYRTMVSDVFHSETQGRDSPARTDDSIHRSNTTSTSEISPIVSKPAEPQWDRGLAENVKRANEHEASRSNQDQDDFIPPRRIGTNRKDSPSPARRPLSVEAPAIPEPQSAISMAHDSPAATQDTARAAQLIRPGPAVLVHSRGNSGDSIHANVPRAATGVAGPSLRNQESYTSELSERSNQRTASEEWAQWSAAQREAHARHGIQDSNPATPGPDSSGMSSPALPFDSLDKNVQPTKLNTRNENTKLSAANTGLPWQRPQVTRDESFRPVLPGGWESSASIQKATIPEPTGLLPPRPGFGTAGFRNDSTESIPTATAPRSANWKSEYTGIQAQAFAAASAAGDALAGIFNGPSLTSRGGDSEVSSITDSDDQNLSTRRDPSLFTRDFAASTPDSERAAFLDSSAARDFASTKQETPEASQVTPKARQEPFAGASKLAPLTTSHSDLKGAGTDSPTKESERWWSDDEDAAAPAPLRTSRMSAIEPTRPRIAHSDSDEPDADQLHSDIVQSLTPKSSSIAEPVKQESGRVSPLRQEVLKSTSPPFAAAALAMSPARALQEQNSWKPLSAPQSKAVSPEAEKLPVLGVTPSQGEISGGNEQAPVSTQPGRDRPAGATVPSTGSGATKSWSGTPHQELGPPAPKSFTIHDDVPTLPPLTIGTAEISETTKSAPVATSDKSTPLPVTAQYPSRVRTNEATMISDDKAHLHDSTPLGQAQRALVKELPNPITSSSAIVERSSTPTRNQDLPAAVTPQSTKGIQPPFNSDPGRSFPGDQVPFSQIASMGSAQQRIKAYNDNRDAYTQPVGHLENWLSFMNTPEHADAFAAKPLTSTSYAPPTSRHQQRDSIGVPGGTKQIQEDGKRLLASASKYGSKAGVLGKGLFSKGKEKLRTVSAGQKVAR